MTTRRTFLKAAALGAGGLVLSPLARALGAAVRQSEAGTRPMRFVFFLQGNGMYPDYPPNPWGFHDMHGNLWEWTSSYYRPRHQAGAGATPRPAEATSGGSPVARGGSWVSLPDYCRSGFLHHFESETERDFIGFRIALRRKDRDARP